MRIPTCSPFTFFFIFIIGLLLPICGYSSTVVIEDETQSLTLMSELSFFEDRSGQLRIDQVSSAGYRDKFIQNSENVLNFGRTRSTYWVRFEIQSHSAESGYLLVDYPIAGSSELFVVSSDDNSLSGSLIQEGLFKKHSYRIPLYRLKLPANEHFTVYLRANNGKAILKLPIQWKSADAMLAYSQVKYAFFMAIFVSLWVLAIYNAFLFISLRESSYLALIVFIVGIQFFFYRDSNLFPSLQFLNNPHGYFYSLPELTVAIAAFQFWRNINQNRDPIMEKISVVVIVTCIVFVPFCGLFFYAQQFIFIVIIILSPFLVLLITRHALTGQALVVQSYLAVLVFILSMQFFAYHMAGVSSVDYGLSVYAGQIGILVAVILLSLTQGAYSHELRVRVEKNTAENKVKDEVLRTMSHELRTPMNAMLSSNTLLLNTSLNQQQKQYLQHQETASKHMISLINQVLDFSSIKNNALTLEHHAFALDDVLRQLDELFRIQAESKGLLFKINRSRNSQMYLLGDSTRLLQVLINLVGNAIKFTEKGSVLVDVIQNESIENQALFVEFVVRDSGIGISADHQHQLFKPFSQLNKSHSRHHDGTGLGLAISYKLVGLMGGELHYENSQKRGSCFSFAIELAMSDIPEEKLTSQAETNIEKLVLQGVKVLLVDDDPINLYLGKALLETSGVQVMSADNGKAALGQIQRELFHAVFMDVSMPDMDGYETTQKIRQELSQRTLPIIALTAHAIVGERERCLESGMNDYLTKPFEPSDLQAMLLKWVAPSLKKEQQEVASEMS